MDPVQDVMQSSHSGRDPRIEQQCSNLVIVTNEVFSESVPDSAGDERIQKDSRKDQL